MSETIPKEKIKTLGQVLTPPKIAEFLAKWAIQDAHDKVLEPSFGDGVFLKAAIKRLLELGATPEQVASQVHGVEFDKTMFELTRAQIYQEFGITLNQINADFFDVEPAGGQRTLLSSPLTIPRVNAVIGNPPYVRYQHFNGELRKKALRVAEDEGVRLTELTASWVPFVIHAKRFLKKGGRMAFVLPSKLLHVSYAKQFRKWLLREFPTLTIIAFEKRVFPEILEDTILLLAENEGPEQVIFLTLRDETELDDYLHQKSTPTSQMSFYPSPSEKWTKYLLPSDLMRSMNQITERANDNLIQLRDVGFVTIGVVTGDNKFFTLTEQEVEKWDIEDKYLLPIVTKAEDLNGIVLTNDDWLFIKKIGRKCYLLHVTEPENYLSKGLKEYLEKKGKELNVRLRYKVRIRKRWYEVPGVRFPDLFMSYMVHDVPKVTANQVVINGKRATSTNTIHHIFLKEDIEPVALATAFYNSLTLASAELSGRFYGGGVLKLEPKEAEKILIPKIVEVKQLLRMTDKVNKYLRRKKTLDAVEMVNEVMLEEWLGLSDKEIETLTEVWQYLQENRMKKNKS
ncbi:HsdM family class I SAM-dependent methyltransferase [Geoglobus ahangari]